MGLLVVAVCICVYIICRQNRKYKELDDRNIKFQDFYDVLVQWIKVKQNNKKIENYFKKNNYRTVAIYGMNEIGFLLANELNGTEVIVKYGIDRNAKNIDSQISIVTPQDELGSVDVIVVTAFHYYNSIEPELRDKTSYDVVSLEDVLYEVLP